MERQRVEAQQQQQMELQHEEVSAMASEAGEALGDDHTPFVREGMKVGRNDACPCGSGKKYKQCHGKLG